MYAFDGQTDRETDSSSLDRVCIPCSAIKSKNDKLLATTAAVHYEIAK